MGGLNPLIVKGEYMPIATKEITTAKSLSTKQLSAMYDRIYDIADKLIKKYNPCNIHIKGKKLYCTQHYKDKAYNTDRLCCSGCGEFPDSYTNHWSKTGCTTKCLACKLYLCSTAYRKISRRVCDQLYRLRKFAKKYGLPASSYYFVSKEEWLKQRGNYGNL